MMWNLLKNSFVTMNLSKKLNLGCFDNFFFNIPFWGPYLFLKHFSYLPLNLSQVSETTKNITITSSSWGGGGCRQWRGCVKGSIHWYINFVIDLELSDSSFIRLKEEISLRRFLVVQTFQVILVEPDSARLGWGVVTFSCPIQDLEISQDARETRSEWVEWTI